MSQNAHCETETEKRLPNKSSQCFDNYRFETFETFLYKKIVGSFL
jgi:hypothetical protein